MIENFAKNLSSIKNYISMLQSNMNFTLTDHENSTLRNPQNYNIEKRLTLIVNSLNALSGRDPELEKQEDKIRIEIGELIMKIEESGVISRLKRTGC